MYYLVDTHTRNAAFGDPKLDPLNSGQVDAFLNFERMHGYKHGEFFGVLIPKSNQDLWHTKSAHGWFSFTFNQKILGDTD